VTAAARSVVLILFGPLLVASAEAGLTRRFIVAFELSGQGGFDFTWPHESLPRFPEDQVLMVVESMPRALEAGSAGRPVALSASRHLRINGVLRRPRTPPQDAAGPVEFLVPLEKGRLRLSLTLPAAMRFDPNRGSAVIRLYHVEKEEGGAP
jgi:hypothetical protein